MAHKLLPKSVSALVTSVAFRSVTASVLALFLASPTLAAEKDQGLKDQAKVVRISSQGFFLNDVLQVGGNQTSILFEKKWLD